MKDSAEDCFVFGGDKRKIAIFIQEKPGVSVTGVTVWILQSWT